MKTTREIKMIVRALFAIVVAALGAVPTLAQFSSGSTGADGALNFTTPGTVIFDPVALGLNPAGNNIFNFTTINIGPGVTVQLVAHKLRERSVVWLATGAVTIAGTLNLSGANAYPAGNSSLRSPSEPGPGGYAGGVGASDSSPSEPGAGPGGGAANSGDGSYATGGDGPTYGNSLLVPLRGGSGGGGGVGSNISAGGGAGGGAIQIVSSASVIITGSIMADGGNNDEVSNEGGAGSGGAIHIEAPTFSGSGSIQAVGGQRVACCGYQGVGGNGWIRVDTATNSLTGTIQPAATFGPLFNSPLPSAVPTISILSIDGVAVPAVPTGSFLTPDVTFNSGSAVPITLAATNIPVGTVLTLTISSETGADQVVASSALTGTVASSTATASVVWPLGVSRIYVRATW